MKIHRLALGLAGCLCAFGAPARSAEVTQPQTLEELIAKAKASNHVVTLVHEDTLPEVVRAKEKAFQERFGFPVTLVYPPGHHRDMPVKIIESAKAGRGVVDIWTGGTPLVLNMFRDGYTRMPPWKAIYAGWPLAEKLRRAVPKIGGGPGGMVLSDHCMLEGFTAWSFVYNPLRVTKSELKGITLDDLTTQKWHNRVAWDVNALGLYALPFAPGWTVERMRVFAHNLGANGVKLVTGGTPGIIQSLIQGEADISYASSVPVFEEKSLGAPIDVAFSKFIMGNVTVTCLITPGVGDPNMAALYWAWDNFDGFYTEAKLTGGGAFRFVKEEEKELPVVHAAIEGGITSEDQLIGPKTEEESQVSGKYRKIAIEALKEGVRSKTKITE